MEGEEQMAPAIRSILATARAREPPGRSVDVDARPLSLAVEAARAEGRMPIIAEIKPTSPTTDGIHDADPATLARAMVDGGAAAISVLTEAEHFGGSPEALRDVREAVDVPVLRKDFILEPSQLDTVPADVILLIARFVDDLPTLIAAARDRGFQVLVEVHTPPELETAIDADARFIGINNRDLTSLAVDRETFARVAGTLPPDTERTLIAESGISTVEDVRRMRDAGADALLIGTAIMNGDVRENTQRLTEA